LRIDAEKDGARLVTRFDVSLEAVGEVLHLCLTDGRLEPEQAALQGFDPSTLEAVMSQAMPVLVLSRDGSFQRLEGVAEAQALMAQAMERMMAQLLAELDDETRAEVEAMQQVLLKTFSEPSAAAGISANASQLWQTCIGVWLGLELSDGERLQRRHEQPMPGGAVVAASLLYTHHGEDSEHPGCIRISVRSENDPEQMRSFVEQFVRARVSSMGLPLGEQALVESNTQESELELVLEKQSMRPRLVRSEIRSRMVYTEAMGGEVSEKHLRQDYRFDWE
jgi:hypothetical protein